MVGDDSRTSSRHVDVDRSSLSIPVVGHIACITESDKAYLALAVDVLGYRVIDIDQYRAIGSLDLDDSLGSESIAGQQLSSDWKRTTTERVRRQILASSIPCLVVGCISSPYDRSIRLDLDVPRDARWIVSYPDRDYAVARVAEYLDRYRDEIVQGRFPVDLLDTHKVHSVYQQLREYYVRLGYRSADPDQLRSQGWPLKIATGNPTWISPQPSENRDLLSSTSTSPHTTAGYSIRISGGGLGGHYLVDHPTSDRQRSTDLYDSSDTLDTDQSSSPVTDIQVDLLDSDRSSSTTDVQVDLLGSDRASSANVILLDNAAPRRVIERLYVISKYHTSIIFGKPITGYPSREAAVRAKNKNGGIIYSASASLFVYRKGQWFAKVDRLPVIPDVDEENTAEASSSIVTRYY